MLQTRISWILRRVVNVILYKKGKLIKAGCCVIQQAADTCYCIIHGRTSAGLRGPQVRDYGSRTTAVKLPSNVMCNANDIFHDRFDDKPLYKAADVCFLDNERYIA